MRQEINIDVNTAPRQEIEAAFIQQRDEIMMRIFRFIARVAFVNEERFAEDPMEMDIDFSAQINHFMALSPEDRGTVIANAVAGLHEIEGKPPLIITPDQLRAERNGQNGNGRLG